METLWLVKALRQHPEVACADPNYLRKPLAEPNDPYYSSQWHYPMINLPQAWDATTGSDTIVAVVDTGVLLTHPDLSGQLVSGYDFISDPDRAVDGDGIDPDPDDPGDEEVGGSSFHGTHVAGTIAAASNNGKGGAGVAWQTKVMPLRALGKGDGTLMDILQAVKYAAGLENSSGLLSAEPADIINMSLGGGSASQVEQELYQEVRDAGVIIVASAGNESSSTPSYPAAYNEVVSVSAVTINQELAYYSNFGSTIDVAAPGGDTRFDVNGDGYGDGVLSTAGDDSSGEIQNVYAFSQGTSMAAPHVSGVAALMKSVYNGLTPDQFDTLLSGESLTRDIGTSGRDDSFGHGLIDANKAVAKARELAGNGGQIQATLVVNPGSLNFGGSLGNAILIVQNGGGDSLSVTSVSDDEAWLSVTASDADPITGLGTYTAMVDRDGLFDGTYTAIITFDSTANRVEVPVVMQVQSVPDVVNAGYNYILLIDPDTQETIKQVGVDVDATGLYPYTFSDLLYGESYSIYAGSDPNNNGYICDGGEACGAYISLDQPVRIDVTGDNEALDFITDVKVNFSATIQSNPATSAVPLQRIILKEISK